MLMPTKILVPTDFSEYSDKALKQALDIAAEYKSKVYVLHVVDAKLQSTMTVDHSDVLINFDDIRNLEKSIVKIAKERMRQQVAKFPENKDVQVTQSVKSGVPYEEILREQEAKGIDLIVITSLGNTGIAKYLIGGVARNVLKGATCSVLLTK